PARLLLPGERYATNSCGDRAGDGQQRETALGPLALGLPQIPATDLSLMGSALDRSFGLVPSVLPGAAREGEVAAYGDPSPGVQMDSHPVSLLERPQAVR